LFDYCLRDYDVSGFFIIWEGGGSNMRTFCDFLSMFFDAFRNKKVMFESKIGLQKTPFYITVQSLKNF